MLERPSGSLTRSNFTHCGVRGVVGGHAAAFTLRIGVPAAAAAMPVAAIDSTIEHWDAPLVETVPHGVCGDDELVELAELVIGGSEETEGVDSLECSMPRC